MQLVIDKYGASLAVQDGRFQVRWKDGSQELPVTAVRSILLNRATKLSGEAIAAAVEAQIDIVFVERSGKPYARVWSPKFGSISTIRKQQLNFSQSKEAITWIRGMLQRKIDNQCALLWSHSQVAGEDAAQRIERSLKRLQRQSERIGAAEGASSMHELAPSLRGYEGTASRVYFECLSGMLPEVYRFEGRSQHPAHDAFNCLLNYAYGMLYNLVEQALIVAGIDPYIGVFHRDEYNRPVLVYDFIEQYRVWAEFVVVDLCMQRAVFLEFFEVENGVYWLDSSGKRVLIQTLNDYLAESIPLDKQNRSRANHIRRHAEEFAQYLKTFKTEDDDND